MKNMLNKVISLLTAYPSLRDSDERLAANIWHRHIKNVDEIDAITLLSRFAEGKLPSYESISRCRRKIQEEKPELRGKKWAKRHSKQKVIKEQIKEIGVMLNG
tara:strand:+ start:114 stop:422 length:309 start_codon:yes stop_codon:yes gene_type:complete